MALRHACTSKNVHKPTSQPPEPPPLTALSALATLIRSSTPLKWSFRHDFRLKSSFVSSLAKTKLRLVRTWCCPSLTSVAPPRHLQWLACCN